MFYIWGKNLKNILETLYLQLTDITYIAIITTFN